MLSPSRVRRAGCPRPAGGARDAWRRGAKRPWYVFLITLGLLLLQGPMALHLLLVPHATCEHGELIELRQANAGAQAGERARAFSNQTVRATHSASAQIEVAHGDGTGHDHCDALAVRHQIPEVGASVAAASLVWITPIRGAGDHAEARPVPLLLLAPKSSPPAARA